MGLSGRIGESDEKIGLYAGIMLLLILLYGCKGEENEVIQDSIETETRENHEEIQDNAFTVSASEISGVAKEEVEVVWNAENASVSDSDFTITLGMLFEDFEYCEEELPTVIVDNLVGNIYAYGAWHDVYFHPYTDLTVYTSDYNPVNHDMSGENIYIVQIDIETSRFCTDRGIAVGATLDELREAYLGEDLVEIDKDVPVRFRYIYREGYVSTGFYVDMEQQQVTRISLALVIQDNIETETGETAENIQDNAFTVSDSDYSITLGTLLADFEYTEEDMLAESADSYCGLVSLNGVWHDLYIRSYTDFAVLSSDYNPATREISGENKYIVSIELKTSRFCTDRGITVGATLDELWKAYYGAKLIYKDESASGRLIYTYEDGLVRTTFCVDKEQNRVTEITLYVW